jgi:glucose/arabinose dehydrogenase
VDCRRQAIALSAICFLIALAAACSDSPSPGEPAGGGGGAPAPQVPQAPRLAWSQAAPSSAAAQAYRFILFIDGARTPFSGAVCSGAAAPAGFDCAGPLPALTAGRRVLEIAATDPGTMLESGRSAPLTVEVGSDGRPRALLTDDDGSGAAGYADQSVPSPSTACAAGTPTDCFAVGLVATGIAPVRRLLSLPDGRLLALLENGGVTMLPSGSSERPEFAARGDASTVGVADVAADPDFHVNRFLYFATTARAPDGRRTVSVVRVRELADRLGEFATLVAELPAATAGNPAIAIGPDQRIYLAMPGAPEDRAGYGGQILRFTGDGKAAGNARLGSPIAARGRAQPARLAWDATSRLLIASGESGPAPVLFVIPPAGGQVAWPGALIGVAGPVANLPNTGLSDVAAAPASPDATATLAMIEGNPGSLVIAALTAANPPQIGSKSAIDLPSLTPTAVAFASNGDLFVAASRGREPLTILLRLRRISPDRAP